MVCILITGGAGFIGSNLIEKLVKKGYKVKVIDDLSTGGINNIKPFLDKVGRLCFGLGVVEKGV